MPFHAGLSASPDSSFVARDRWECWRLCREMNAECTQVGDGGLYRGRWGIIVLGGVPQQHECVRIGQWGGIKSGAL